MGKIPKMPQVPETDVVEAVPQADTAPARPGALTGVIPDKYKLDVRVAGNGAGYVASAKLGEMDVLHGEFPVGGSTSGELHATIRGDSASIEGQVTLGGQPAVGAQIYLIPTTGGGAGYKLGFGDLEGHYKITGVAPGDCRIQAWTGWPTAKDILSGAGESVTCSRVNDARPLSKQSKAAIHRTRWDGLGCDNTHQVRCVAADVGLRACVLALRR
jgi:hypothetical protein